MADFSFIKKEPRPFTISRKGGAACVTDLMWWELRELNEVGVGAIMLDDIGERLDLREVAVGYGERRLSGLQRLL